MKSHPAFLCLLLLIGSVTAPGLRAEVSIASIFTDHMVLQRDRPLPVWGEASPGETVTVKFRTATASTTTEENGRWRVTLAPQKIGASGEIEVTGKNKITLTDVVVGEVWICSGQSNMAFTLEKVADGKTEVAAASHPEIRLFQTAKAEADQPATALSGQWLACTPASAAKFSAVAYFFALEVQRSLGVPVGLIHSSVGGTAIEKWTSADGLAAFQETLVIEKPTTKKAAAANRESILYNGMIAPLVPFAVRGFLWYQGEANSHTAERSVQYEALFKNMITQWRRDFGQGDLPFYFVQLANFQTPVPNSGFWPLLRQSQAQALKLPATGMAVTIDVGNPTNIHPTNKKEVGRRLSLIALKQVYGKDVVDRGPECTSHARDGMALRLNFSQTLVLKDAPEPSFELAGADGKFFPAKAEIAGDTLRLASDQVADPVIARYAWSNSPAAVLFNDSGLPAPPFIVGAQKQTFAQKTPAPAHTVRSRR